MENSRSIVVSLIGRPNVGKSTLFNRLMRNAQKAITFDKPGVTRDRHYGIAKFDELANENEQECVLVDTGGFYPEQHEEDVSVKGKSHLEQEQANFNKFFNVMTDHAEMAIDESDLVLFIVDVREGLLPFDEMISKFIRGRQKKFWLIINKYDSDKQAGYEAEFYGLGLDPENVFVISSAHGTGVTELKERIQEFSIAKKNSKGDFSTIQQGIAPKSKVVSKIALIGAPNAGKSTMLNRLVGAKRALVCDVAGTTVDPIQGFFELDFRHHAYKLNDVTKEGEFTDKAMMNEYKEFQRLYPQYYKESTLLSEDDLDEAEMDDISEDLVISKEEIDQDIKTLFKEDLESNNDENLETPKKDKGQQESTIRSLHIVDTAGIRRKSSVKGFIESQSVFRALRSITESDIVIYMIDATQGIGHQDRRLLDIALEKGKSIIICLNKMDLMREKLKTQAEQESWILDLRYKLPWLGFCDLIPLSAKTGKSIYKLERAIIKTVLVRRQKISTADLNKVIFELVDKNPIILKGSRGKGFKVKYASMIKSSPPTFLLFTNKSKGVPDNFKRYLQNGIRRELLLYNSPVHLLFKTGNDLEKRMKKVK